MSIRTIKTNLYRQRWYLFEFKISAKICPPCFAPQGSISIYSPPGDIFCCLFFLWQKIITTPANICPGKRALSLDIFAMILTNI
jgi:hypothetical protein